MTAIRLDRQTLEALYSVVFCIDRDGRLRHASAPPQRYLGDLEPGVDFFAYFTFLRPASVSGVEDLLGRKDALFLVKDREERFAARGQVVELDWDGESLVVFCGSPWLFWMNANCPDARLGIADFPAQDSQLDQLFLMTTEQRMVSDLEQLNGELKTAKREIEAAQEARNALFARMSHEMRTPLNGVVSALALLSDQALPEEAQKLLSLAQSSSRNLLHVINYVLDISKLEIGEAILDPVLFNLPAALKSVTEIVRARAVEKGLTLDWQTSRQLDEVYIGDKAKLRQCLLNLVTNAIKFTDSGFVTVRALPSASGKPDTVRFEVEDTGVGISGEDQERIFEPFWTGRDLLPVFDRGTGLGLDIVRRNVDVMGGSLGVISRLGKGSVFWLEIPLEIADPDLAADFSPEGADGPTPTRLRGRILLVDDNTTNLLLGRKILESLGLEVEEAHDGASAVSRAHGEPFDLVLMDISMPGMDGVTATREIRKFASREELPVVALTAFASSEERDRCLRMGMNEYLTKPIVRARMAEQLAVWLDAVDEPLAEDSPAAPTAGTELQSEAPLLDDRVLAALCEQIGAGNLAAVLDQFEREVADRWGAFADALANADPERLTREAHTLASTCRSLGLADAGETFSAIETQLRDSGALADIRAGEAEARLRAGLAALERYREDG